MDRLDAIRRLRGRIRNGGHSIGSWMQIPDPSVAEIMGQAGYDWVAIDLEHGSVAVHQLPNLFRALELGGTLPLARVAQGHAKECKQALDAGAAGVIVPMIESAEQLAGVRDICRWPPSGIRGVGFSRANLFGKSFDSYREEAQSPLLIAMVEHVRAVGQLEAILQVDGLDALLIGPYDLSASMGLTGKVEDPEVQRVMQRIRALSERHGVACGIHVVHPSPERLRQRLQEGYRFLGYSIDAVFLVESSRKVTSL